LHGGDGLSELSLDELLHESPWWRGCHGMILS
jgi:hypothetical protein